MHRTTEKRILPYTPEHLHALVLDIEKYPEFLPWCRGARITERESDHFIGELIISFAHITERYASRVESTPPQHGREGTIKVTLVHGPFTHLNNNWRFVPHANGTEVHFDVSFQFKAKLLDKLIGGMFTRASEKMIDAFTKRAATLHNLASEAMTTLG